MFRVLSIFAVSMLLLVSAIASPTPLFFDKKVNHHRHIQQKTAQPTDAVIPNFTGHWTGTCQGRSELFIITIEQGDATFKIFSDSNFSGEYQLGGVSHQRTITSYGDNRFSQRAVFWNPYLQILSLNIVETQMGNKSIFPMSTDILALSFSLDHDQLVVEGDQRYFDGTEESEAAPHLICTLSKTPESHSVNIELTDCSSLTRFKA